MWHDPNGMLPPVVSSSKSDESLRPGNILYLNIAIKYGVCFAFGCALFFASWFNTEPGFIHSFGCIMGLVIMIGLGFFGLKEIDHQERLFNQIVPKTDKKQSPQIQEIHIHTSDGQSSQERIKHFDANKPRPSQEFIEFVSGYAGQDQLPSERAFAETFPGEPTNEWLTLLEGDGWLERKYASKNNNAPRRVTNGAGRDKLLIEYGYDPTALAVDTSKTA